MFHCSLLHICYNQFLEVFFNKETRQDCLPSSNAKTTRDVGTSNCYRRKPKKEAIMMLAILQISLACSIMCTINKFQTND